MVECRSLGWLTPRHALTCSGNRSSFPYVGSVAAWPKLYGGYGQGGRSRLDSLLAGSSSVTVITSHPCQEGDRCRADVHRFTVPGRVLGGPAQTVYHRVVASGRSGGSGRSGRSGEFHYLTHVERNRQTGL